MIERLKPMIKNKARVEGSICEAVLMQEVATFCSMYFKNKKKKQERHFDGGEIPVDYRLAIFRYPGRGSYPIRSTCWAEEKDLKAAHLCVLNNTEEMKEYKQYFEENVKETMPTATAQERCRGVGKNLADWFEELAESNPDTMDGRLIQLAEYPDTVIQKYKAYSVNGYYFDTTQGDGCRTTYNSGVYVKGNAYGDDQQSDYYGVLEEIWELTYPGQNKVVLFKCYWFDNQSIQVHHKNGMVQIKHKSRAYKDDPFIVAQTAEQVYYLPYVSKRKDHKDWWVVIRTKPRSRVDWTHIENIVGDEDTIDVDDILQETFQPEPQPVSPTPELDTEFDYIGSDEESIQDEDEDEDDDEDQYEDEGDYDNE